MSTPIDIAGFTSRTLAWQPWLQPVDASHASPAQSAVLAESGPTAHASPFYLTLAHQPEVLRERSRAFNAIMYAPGGLPRAERELASAVVSRINGCVYCASVHAQRFEQLAKRNDTIVQVFTDPDSAGTTERERAIVQFSAALTRSPQDVGAEQIQSLRQAGLTELEILDLIHSIAIFAWANRLMLNLGSPVLKED
jgi:uncharacterized peroxidase-related enzyme